MRDEFYFPSKDGNTEIHTIEWKPEGEVKAVLQLSHGMVEYIKRYDEFAEFMCSHGYYVVGNDHLGHGKSVQSKSEYGFFNEKYGNACVIGDMHTLRQRTMKKYPDVPYFMLGHSMGSSLLRQYVQMYGNGLAGAMAVGAYNRKFKNPKTRADWVTSDEEHLEKYISDPLCSFAFTVNAYYSMFTGMLIMEKKESIYMIPKQLPILFAAGAEDPVGGFGKGVRKVYEKYKAAGIQDISLRLYAGDRHELLNETDREQVYEDLLEWMEERRKINY